MNSNLNKIEKLFGYETKQNIVFLLFSKLMAFYFPFDLKNKKNVRKGISSCKSLF